MKRLRSIVCLMSKAINNEGPMNLTNIFALNENNHSRIRVYLLITETSIPKKNGFNSIFCQGSCWW